VNSGPASGVSFQRRRNDMIPHIFHSSAIELSLLHNFIAGVIGRLHRLGVSVLARSFRAFFERLDENERCHERDEHRRSKARARYNQATMADEPPSSAPAAPSKAVPYQWDPAEAPATEILQLWTEVGNGLDKSQTGELCCAAFRGGNSHLLVFRQLCDLWPRERTETWCLC